MRTARTYLSAILLALLPLAAEATHQEVPVHAHDEDLNDKEDAPGATAPGAG